MFNSAVDRAQCRLTLGEKNWPVPGKKVCLSANSRVAARGGCALQCACLKWQALRGRGSRKMRATTTPGVQARQFGRRMKFFVTGHSCKTAPVEVRERLAVLPSTPAAPSGRPWPARSLLHLFNSMLAA